MNNDIEYEWKETGYVHVSKVSEDEGVIGRYVAIDFDEREVVVADKEHSSADIELVERVPLTDIENLQIDSWDVGLLGIGDSE